MHAATAPLLPLSHVCPACERARREAVHRAFWQGEDIGRPLLVPIPWENKPIDGGERDATGEWWDRTRRQALCPVDTLPFYACSEGTVDMASAWGGVITVTQGKPWIAPVMTCPEDVYKLELPAPDAGTIGRSIARWRALNARCDAPVAPAVPDMQGPLQVASMLWMRDDEFILAMTDHPKEVHHLLDLVTRHIIQVIELFQALDPQVGMSCWPPGWYGREMGCMIVEDFVQLLSPRLYVEYGLPYTSRIAERFGGVFIHCCARCKQHWPAFKRIPNLRGLDTMYPFTKPEEVYAFFPGIVHSIGCDYAEMQRSFKDKGEDAWLEFLIPRTPRDTRWRYVTGCDDPATVPRQLDIIERTWARR